MPGSRPARPLRTSSRPSSLPLSRPSGSSPQSSPAATRPASKPRTAAVDGAASLTARIAPARATSARGGTPNASGLSTTARTSAAGPHKPRAGGARTTTANTAPRRGSTRALAAIDARVSAATSAPASNVLLHPTIALLRTASLSSAAQQEIERMILAGEIGPGAKLTEAWLSERLGISRGPIREAFRMLEEAGLVRQEKNRGVFVRAIPLEEAVEIYDLRAVMDELVGRRLAARITPEQTRRVKLVVDQMDQAARTDDVDAYHLLNLQFHDQLVEFAGNQKMAAIYRKLVKELALFRRRNLAHKEVLPQSAAEHRQILRAITSGDPEAAARAMFQHVTESKERMLRSEAQLNAASSRAADAAPLRARAARR